MEQQAEILCFLGRSRGKQSDKKETVKNGNPFD